MVLFCKQLNPLNSRMLCALLGWPWPSGSQEKKISIKFCWCIFCTLYFVIISIWKKGALHLNKPKSLSRKDTLCHIWMKLAHWFWRRFLNYFNVFLLFCCHHTVENGGAFLLNIILTDFSISFYLPLKKGVTDFIWKQLKSLSHKMLGAKIGWNWPNGSSEEDEIEKSVQREGWTDRWMDNGRSEKLTRACGKVRYSFKLRWRYVYWTMFHWYRRHQWYCHVKLSWFHVL